MPVVLSPQDAIMAAINMAYDMSRASAKDYFEEMNDATTDDLISKIDETADLLDETSDAPIIKLVNLLVAGAIKDRASDIHVEPYSGNLKIRYRIDGILYDILNLPRRIQSPLVSRIKIMAKLNIAEKRLPQDGRIEIKIADRLVDIRVSVIPTAFGERVVLRLLDKTANILMLSDLGMHDQRVKTSQSPDQITLRDHSGNRPHRQRQNNHLIRGAFHHQSSGNKHHHHRRPHRVSDGRRRPDSG